MGKNQFIRPFDLSERLAAGFKKVRENLIADEKKKNGYFVVTDKKGNVIKVSAKDL